MQQRCSRSPNPMHRSPGGYGCQRLIIFQDWNNDGVAPVWLLLRVHRPLPRWILITEVGAAHSTHLRQPGDFQIDPAALVSRQRCATSRVGLGGSYLHRHRWAVNCGFHKPRKFFAHASSPASSSLVEVLVATVAVIWNIMPAGVLHRRCPLSGYRATRPSVHISSACGPTAVQQRLR
jgi:hypothetical protein